MSEEVEMRGPYLPRSEVLTRSTIPDNSRIVMKWKGREGNSVARQLTMLRVCMMHACVVFSTWINSSQSSWSNPLTSDRILIGDRAASLSVDLPLSGDGINSCPSSSSSSARSSQSVALISCHRFHRSIPVPEIIADGEPINVRIRRVRRPWRGISLFSPPPSLFLSLTLPFSFFPARNTAGIIYLYGRPRDHNRKL